MISFYSNVTGKRYATKEEAEKAELKVANERKAKEIKEKVLGEQRKADAEKVTKALESARKAEKEATELLSKFCDKYGSFHTSYTIDDLGDDRLSLLDLLFGFDF